MATWIPYKGLEVPDVSTGDAGIRLTDGLKKLADRAPYNFAGNPTVNDDSTKSFDEGSHWFNTATQTMWVCTDAVTPGAAKWRSLYRRVDNAIVLAPDAGVGSGSDGRAIQLDASGSDARGANAVDFQRTRAASSQVASGANAALVGGLNNKAFSQGSAIVGGQGNNAGGGSGSISNIAIGNPTTITSNAHGLSTGQVINVSGSNSTPTINGDRQVTWLTANTFRVAVNVTAAGNAGTWTSVATSAYAFVGGGQNNAALGKCSHAEGISAYAIGYASHAEGGGTVASNYAAHAEGRSAIASGHASHAEGINTWANSSFSHAEGYAAVASGSESHAEGRYGVASGAYSHKEGGNTTASGTAAHAEGRYAVASGFVSHAEGNANASNSYSHAETHSFATGPGAHAEGASTASSYYTHAGGVHGKARLWCQWARASGGHSNQLGSAQTTITHLFRRTTNASATELTLDGSAPSASSRLTLADGQTMSCFVNVVGRKENGGTNDHGSFLRQVCIRREGSTTQLVGSAQTVGVDINPATWGGVTISADDTNESLKIEVAGANADIRWMATVIASEVADAAI